MCGPQTGGSPVCGPALRATLAPPCGQKESCEQPTGTSEELWLAGWLVTVDADRPCVLHHGASVGSLDGDGHLAAVGQAGQQAVAQRERWLQGGGGSLETGGKPPQWPAQAAHLQLSSNPPIEDGQVGVGRKKLSTQVHLLVPPDHRNHLQVDFL